VKKSGETKWSVTPLMSAEHWLIIYHMNLSKLLAFYELAQNLPKLFLPRFQSEESERAQTGHISRYFCNFCTIATLNAASF
jgi:hypothetical protein